MEPKDQAIIQAFEETVVALRELTHHVHHMDSFLKNNFRQYPSYGTHVYGVLDSIRMKIGEISKLSATNRDSVHRLSKEYESVGKDADGICRMSKVSPVKDCVEDYLLDEFFRER